MIRFLSPFLLVFITIYCSENPNRIENKTTETNNNLSTGTYSYKAIKLTLTNLIFQQLTVYKHLEVKLKHRKLQLILLKS